MRTKTRFLAFLGALAGATTVAVALEGASAAAQTPAPRPAAGQPARTASRGLRTPWGAPDLQGIWNTNTLVPFERAREFGTRAMMTEEQHTKALDELQVRNQRPGRDSRDVGGKPGVGTEKDVARAYNEFWFGDKPTKLSYRTSMIIDPEDGRLLPYTPAAAKRIADKREFLAALLQGTSGGRPGPISPSQSSTGPRSSLRATSCSTAAACFPNGRVRR